MTENPNFVPVLPAHAIERCGITIIYDQGLPDKIFQRVRKDIVSGLKLAGLHAQPQQGISISFDAKTGAITPAPNPVFGPMQFVSNDGASQLVFAPNSLVWHTTRYIRWQPFIGEFEAVVGPIISSFLNYVSISSISIEYWDRFIWTGSWENIDYAGILNFEGGLINRPPATIDKEWHSHLGWFERSELARRLINVNVDIHDFLTATAGISPSVSIYTLLRDELSAPGYGRAGSAEIDYTALINCLDELHVASKLVLARTITGDMKDRITLFPSDAD
jgi:uncharacterized protein (TIGR04255 family)